MPSKKPRMMLTIPFELDEALKQFAEATGVAPASFATEVLVMAIPQIIKLTEAAKMALHTPNEALDLMAETLARSQADAAQMQLGIQQDKRRLRARRSDAKRVA